MQGAEQQEVGRIAYAVPPVVACTHAQQRLFKRSPCQPNSIPMAGSLKEWFWKPPALLPQLFLIDLSLSPHHTHLRAGIGRWRASNTASSAQHHSHDSPVTSTSCMRWMPMRISAVQKKTFFRAIWRRNVL